MEKLRIDVGDRGYVLLKDWMGTDLSPVNDAKVSFDKEASELGPKEKRLIYYLAEHEHTSPFRHSVLKFEVYAPLMVARQWWKHIIGSEHGEPFDRLTAWTNPADAILPRNPFSWYPLLGSGAPRRRIASRAAATISLRK